MSDIKDILNGVWTKIMSPILTDFSDTVVYNKADKVNTVWDFDFDQPSGDTNIIRGSNVSLKARVNFGEKKIITEGGQEIILADYFDFQTSDLDGAGVDFDFGDYITFNSIEYRISEIELHNQIGDEYKITKAIVEKVKTKTSGF